MFPEHRTTVQHSCVINRCIRLGQYGLRSPNDSNGKKHSKIQFHIKLLKQVQNASLKQSSDLVFLWAIVLSFLL